MRRGLLLVAICVIVLVSLAWPLAYLNREAKEEGYTYHPRVYDNRMIDPFKPVGARPAPYGAQYPIREYKVDIPFGLPFLLLIISSKFLSFLAGIFIYSVGYVFVWLYKNHKRGEVVHGLN